MSCPRQSLGGTSQASKHGVVLHFSLLVAACTAGPMYSIAGVVSADKSVRSSLRRLFSLKDTFPSLTVVCLTSVVSAQVSTEMLAILQVLRF